MTPQTNLRWHPLNPPNPDDYLLVDQNGRVYAHVEQIDDRCWWACCYVWEAWEDPTFDTKQDAMEYCEGVTRSWLKVYADIRRLIGLTSNKRPNEHARRFDIKTEPPKPERRYSHEQASPLVGV